MAMLKDYSSRFPHRLLALLLLSCATVSSQDHSLSPERRTQIVGAVSQFMAATHVPGVAIAVVEKGELKWATGFGFADLENNAPTSEHTLFRLGSISKSLTAVAAMELSERGELDLDAPVEKYCPRFPQKSAPITTRLVMGHLAGIRHYKSDSQDDLEGGNTKHFDDPIQAGLDFFKNDALVADPGTQFHYSTQGYTLVGCIIEGASGDKYVDFVTRNVLVPAGMSHTQSDDRFAIIPYRTRFYRKTSSGTVENADFLDSSYKIPGGGWLSSAEDMGRFEVAILHDTLLKRSTRDRMLTPLKPGDGKPNGYALGWGTFKDNGIFSAGHSGGQQGTSTDFLITPEKSVGVVVLANMEEIPVDQLSREILKILLAAGNDQKP